MSRTRLALPLQVFILLMAAPLFASEVPSRDGSHLLRAEAHADRAVEVRGWSPRSPQQLLRVDGELYQRQDDLLFPVV